MLLRPGTTESEFRSAVEDLHNQVRNFSAWSASPSPDGLRNVYLAWVQDAEAVARRHLLDVPIDQFATVRWTSVLSNAVPSERLWSVVDGDASAQLDWFDSVVVDLDVEHAQDEPIVDRLDGPWKRDHIRVFLSHVSNEKAFAAAVSDELNDIGIDGFVAHDAIEPSLEWQAEIERALKSADALVGLVHPGFAVSFWTQQEVGWALGRRIPVFMVRLGEDPRGFTAKYQAPSRLNGTPWQVASSIAVWLSKDPKFELGVVTRLIEDVRNAASFVEARDAAERLEQVGQLSPPLLDELARAYRSNDQIYPRHVGARVVERILKAHGRELPA